MRSRRPTIVVAVLVAAIGTTVQVSYAQPTAEVSPFSIGINAQLKIDKAQIKKLVEAKGLSPNSTSAKQLTKQLSGEGVALEELDDKEVLDFWKVLTPEQRDNLAKQFKTAPPRSPSSFPGLPLSGGPSPFHIPPNETTPPTMLFQRRSPALSSGWV